jgi:transposase
MENVTLTQKEQARLQVLNSLLAEQMTVDQAATLMGVSARHTKRILAAYREEGAAALAHGHRGRRAPNTTPEPLRSEVLRLARSRYSETNHTHLSELLREREGIEVGRTTLRRILTSAGLKSPRHRRPPRHRVRRQRMPREGMLVQVDGSHHRWLGDHGAPFALLLAVDDATGNVVNALFCEQENTRDYFLLMKGLIQRHGIPIALYTDRHSVFKNVPGSGRAGAPTQFSRAMDELGIQMVFALSPQAKGRVERTAGTFQDRLATELRLAGAVTIEEANALLKEFLDRFNARFGVPAQHLEAAYRPLGPGVCLDTALCFRHSRRVARDNTVKYRWRTLQLLPGTERRSYAGAVADVLEGLDGQLAVRYRGEIIPSQEAPPRPGILRSFNGSSSHGPHSHGGLNGLGRRWAATLVALDAHAGDADDSGAVSARKTVPVSRRKPTPLQTARWNAVQKAKRRGLSIRGIARELGIHRDTAKKYMEAASPPMKRLRVDSA